MAELSFEQGLATFRGKTPTEPLDLVIAGLDTLLEAPPVAEVELDIDSLEGAGLHLQATGRPPPTTIRQLRTRLGQVPRPRPVPVEPIPLDRSDRRLIPERTTELLCAAATPILLKGVQVLPHPILKAAAIATIYACALELAE